jgi:Mg2+ and Co2+ transporter CorA
MAGNNAGFVFSDIVDFNSTQSRRCNECPYRIYVDGEKACENKAKRDTADALEAAERLLDQNTERCEALRKQLRESHESYEQRISELEDDIIYWQTYAAENER